MRDQVSGDRTARAVGSQVRAMGCEMYEIGIRDSVHNVMKPRTWSTAEIEQGIGWLKAENAKGHDIYIRPQGSTGLILIDDLPASALAQLKRDGLAPALFIETSPGNHQAWVRVSQEPIPAEQASAVARILAARYGGDPASTDWRHFGRLAGFTNRKPEHRQANGMYPYVLVRKASGTVATNVAQLLEEANASLRAAVVSTAALTPPLGSLALQGGRTPAQAYAFYADLIMHRFPNPDYSRLDWMVCRDIASGSLAVDQQYLEQALRDGSPNLAERKKDARHIQEYVAATASKALRDPKVITARKGLAQQQQLV